MTRTQKIISSVIMMTLLLASVFAQSQQHPSRDAKQAKAAANGKGTGGRIAKWAGKDGLPTSTLGDSYITEDIFGNVGIGIPNPSSPLTVNGMIETIGSQGGIRFADGTVQTTAFSQFNIPVPLVLRGPVDGPLIDALNDRAAGLAGISIDGIGLVGQSANASGMFGFSTATDPFFAGIFGRGINGASAGRFEGDVNITGRLSKGGGSFKIDHPLDPENKYLSHSFVESPDMKNIYDGVIALDSTGEATVEMPQWFDALNSDFRYLLTAIGAPMPGLYIAEKINGNRFRIAGGQPGLEVSWQVTGIRKDAWANKNRIPVEERKSEKERGHYLHPQAFDQPEERGIEWAQRPEEMRQLKERLQEASQAGRTQR